jgi:hypothetical protein
MGHWYVAVALWIITGKLMLKPTLLTPITYCNAPLLRCNAPLQRCNDPKPVATLHGRVAMTHFSHVTDPNPIVTTHSGLATEQYPVATVHGSPEPG